MILVERKKLPEDWVRASVGELVEILDSQRIPLNSEERALRKGPYPYYGANGQVDSIDDYIFDGDFVLLAEDGGYFDDPSRPVAYRVKGKFWANNHVHILKTLGQIPTQFLIYTLNHADLMPFVSGTTRLKLNQTAMRRIPVSLPPLNEQKRIVAKIEERQTRSRRAREALETIPDLLEQLRQSILVAAFRGDLTKEWRKRHRDVEPASELLKRIRTERRKRWEAAELDKLKAKGLTGDKLDEAFAKQCKKYKEPVPVDASDLPELPEGWCWAGLEELSDWVTDGTHQPPPFTKEGIPFLVISNMVNGEIKWDKVDKWVSPETYDKYTGIYKPKKGDIIYSTVGSYGVAVEVPTEQRFMFQRHIGHIRPFSELLSVTYLTLALNSSFTKSQADKVARGVAQKTVNLSDLRRFCIPLAPAVEQDEIVRLLGQIFQKTEAQQQFIVSSREHLDIFDKSILSNAFRGELVPQDPNDEPAWALLERIREEKEREAVTQKTKARKRYKKMKKKKDKQKNVFVVLREASRVMTPEEVFAAGGFEENSVDAFYEQLRKAVVSKQIRELREGDLVQLEAIGK